MIKKIKVGSSTYEVKIVPIINEDGNIWAQIIYYDRLILLKDGRGKQSTVESIMHEVVHAIEDETKIDHDETKGETDRIARMLIQVIRDNPLLVKMVQETK